MLPESEPAVDLDLTLGPWDRGLRALVSVAVGLAVLLVLDRAPWLLPIASVGLLRDASQARRRRSLRRLRWHADGSLLVAHRDGEPAAAELLPARFVTCWLIALSLRLNDRRIAVAVWRTDQPEAFRRLHQRLRAGRPAAARRLRRATGRLAVRR